MLPIERLQAIRGFWMILYVLFAMGICLIPENNYKNLEKRSVCRMLLAAVAFVWGFICRSLPPSMLASAVGCVANPLVGGTVAPSLGRVVAAVPAVTVPTEVPGVVVLAVFPPLHPASKTPAVQTAGTAIFQIRFIKKPPFLGFGLIIAQVRPLVK